MSEDIIVYITSKGKKYHYNPSCAYIKGKQTNQITLKKANNKSLGACSACMRTIGQNEENCNNNEKELFGSNIVSNKKAKNKKKKEKESINNNIDDFAGNLDIKGKKYKSELADIQISENEHLNIIQKKNVKNDNDILNSNNDIPFLAGNISNIMPNNNFDLYNGGTDTKEKKKKNKKINNKKNKNNIKKDESENESKSKNSYENSIEEMKKNNINNNINNNNNIINDKNNFIFDYSDDKEEEQKISDEESNNYIDSEEIKEKPINDINNINNISNINDMNDINNKNGINKIRDNLKQKNDKNKILNDSDMLLLDETDKSAKILYLQNIFEINDNMNEKLSIISEKKYNDINEKQNDICKGNFRFTFEIDPLDEIMEPIIISVGFEIDYIDESDINVVGEDKYQLNSVNDIKMGAFYETIMVLRHFYIYKKTNTVHVLINICSGKFFVIGENELNKRNSKLYLNSQNSEIMYLRNFNKIYSNQIKDVRPIFKYNKNDLKIAHITINGNGLEKINIK